MKIPYPFTAQNGWVFNYPSWFFICYSTITEHFANIISNINFAVPGQDFCLQSFLIFQAFAKVPKIGFFGLSKRHEKILRLAIFLYLFLYFYIFLYLFLNLENDNRFFLSIKL